MKKKIAIITLHDVKNYGSILQAYATQCYFQMLGMDTVIIDYRRKWETRFGYWLYLSDKTVVGVARNIMYFPTKIIQLFRFNKFKKSKLKLTEKKYFKKDDFNKNPVSADLFCTGSDQVWNSGWNQGVIEEYFLNFVNEKKKISFASSFGSSDISEEDKKIIQPLLKRYDLITVREKHSVEMLKNEFGINAIEILDPTLQLDSEFWKSICESERKIKEKYVLLIQLNRNHEFDKLAVKFAKDRNIELVRLCLRVDQIFLPGKYILIPKVEDYIRLIRDAEYVLTDSFHAVSFCLNLEKNFFIFYPEKYSERLKSIIEIVELRNREISDELVEEEIDYTKIKKILEEKREYARKLIESKIHNI